MKSKDMVRNLNEGQVVPVFLSYVWPLLLSQALQMVYNIVDMIIVGRFIGGAGISAVSIGSDVQHLLLFVAIGFGSAGQVLIAQAVGEGNRRKIRELIGTIFTLLFSVAFVLMVIVFIFRYQLLNVLNTPSESYDYAYDYLVTCTAGLLFTYGYNIVSAVLRGMGDSKRPFIFIGTAAVINLCLDLLFIIKFDMAVFGAALATVIAQSVSFILAIVYLYKNKEAFGFDFKPSSFKIKMRVLRPLLSLGIPMTIQSAAISFSRMIMLSWINSFGLIFSTLAGINNKINSILIIFSISLTAGGSTMTAQALGARLYKRVAEVLNTVTVCATIPAVVVGVIMAVKPEILVGLFTSDPEVLSYAPLLSLPIILNCGGMVTRSFAFSIINGTGKSKLDLLVAILDGVAGKIGLSAIFGFTMSMGCYGIWIGDAVSGYIPFLIGVFFYWLGDWRKGEKKDKPAN